MSSKQWILGIAAMVSTAMAPSMAVAEEPYLYQLLHQDGMYHDYYYYPSWNPYCVYGVFNGYIICFYGAEPLVSQDPSIPPIQGQVPPPSPNDPALNALADMMDPGEPSGVPDGYEPGTDAYGP